MKPDDKNVIVGTDWEAVGPFPSGMREHPLTGSSISAFLDPSIDPDLDFASRPYEDDESWPSELGNGGRVGWKEFQTGNDGWLDISYPEINWDQLRSDHGWSSLQYQSILRTSVAIPKVNDQSKTPFTIDVTQGVEYAFIPADHTEHTGPVEWYSGDIYAFSETPTGQREITSKTSNFARSLSLKPGKYTLLVKAIYEIRMFGDPGLSVSPTIRLKVLAELDRVEEMEVIDGLGEMPDMLDGWFMGDWISVGIRVADGKEDIEVIGVESSFGSSLSLSLPGGARVTPGQTRPVSIKLKQRRSLPSYLQSIKIKFRVKVGSEEKDYIWHPRFKHFHLKDNDQIPPFRITFSSSSSTTFSTSVIPASISHAMIVPPPNPNSFPKPAATDQLRPVLLVLHGAGVDITESMMPQAVPSIPDHWVVLPTGRNEWGEDWHGGSMQDVWSAREAFGRIIQKIGIEVSNETILMGHSNGGQGAWHLAARYPDRIVGTVAASGWLTIQDYVPYTEQTSRHYADPSLMGILSSSLSPFNNDLYLSNLVNIPILVIHGSDDDNVPPRHSRSYLSILSSWAGKQDGGVVKYLEVEKKGHWWDDVIKSTDVVNFITNIPKKKSWDEQRKEGFTLTTANPQENGGRAGIRIVELDIPGRIGRLDVNARQWRDSNPAKPLDLRGMNIKKIELISQLTNEKKILVRSPIQGGWTQSVMNGPLTPPRAYGPMIRILSTAGPMVIICPDIPRLKDVAKGITHDLYVYHRLDSEIIDDREGLLKVAKGQIGESNLVVLGRPDENLFVNWMIKQGKIPLEFPTKGVMLIEDKAVYDRGAGIIALHPHPTSFKALSMLIAGNDDLGLELAARLFPIRTGVMLPDWTVVGPQARWKSAGGFIGAGFWDGEWGWSDSMSWMDR
ncbi:hypothetical protein I204_05041 [Kwoniella mangroviensis CBS 8886]|nr:hypothetical protein I204_05041 [Kwoniella mangroviensis CBS 8886]